MRGKSYGYGSYRGRGGTSAFLRRSLRGTEA